PYGGVLLVGLHHLQVTVDVGLRGLVCPGDRRTYSSADCLQADRLVLKEALQRGDDGTAAAGSCGGELHPALQGFQDRAELLRVALRRVQYCLYAVGVDPVTSHRRLPEDFSRCCRPLSWPAAAIGVRSRHCFQVMNATPG